VGVELFHADGRTDGSADLTKRKFPFSNFAKEPKVLSSATKELIDFVTIIPLKKIDICFAVNHKRLYYFCQYVLHVMTILRH